MLLRRSMSIGTTSKTGQLLKVLWKQSHQGNFFLQVTSKQIWNWSSFCLSVVLWPCCLSIIKTFTTQQKTLNQQEKKVPFLNSSSFIATTCFWWKMKYIYQNGMGFRSSKSWLAFQLPSSDGCWVGIIPKFPTQESIFVCVQCAVFQNQLVKPLCLKPKKFYFNWLKKTTTLFGQAKTFSFPFYFFLSACCSNQWKHARHMPGTCQA